MPYYTKVKVTTYRCKNKLEDGSICGKEFESAQRNPGSAKYCPACRARKPWGRPRLKRL